MTKKEFVVLRNILEKGYRPLRNIIDDTGFSLGTLSNVVSILKERKEINEQGITKLGLEHLKPYQVDNAVILAAGASTRLAPLSFEKPKGLFVVKDEVLIERQIKQLIEAGIKEIVLVLGYKKESFFYLGEKYNVKIVINPSYNIKNNCESIYLAKDYLSRSYLCSCDQYFTVNPFHLYEYESFYTVVKRSNGIYDEPYINKGNNDEISGMATPQVNHYLLMGFSFWNQEFSKGFISLLDKHYLLGTFNHDFWENVFLAHLNELPVMHISERDNDTIFEFDNINQLRDFDSKYIEDSQSKIFSNIASVLKCKQGEITDFLPIKEGMTNTSYTFIVKNKKYVYRHPGYGTNKIIARSNEKQSLILAKKYNIDSSYIYMDENEGWKVSSFFADTRIPSYDDFNDTKLVLDKMLELHRYQISASWHFDPFNDANKMEEYVRNNGEIDMPDFLSLKKDIEFLFNNEEKANLVNKCFCHCDTYRFNWLIDKDNKVTLIDWEYAGYADPGVDVGYYIVDAMYDFDDAKKVIRYYLGDSYSVDLERHYMSYIAITGYYWFVWALFRECCGAVMGESLFNWYYMAKKYVKYVKENYYGKEII